MKVSKTRLPFGSLAWAALGLLAAYSMYGVFTAVSMRPIDPVIRLSLLYYPRRFVPSVPWHVEDHVINTLLFGLPVVVKLVNGLNR